MTGLKFELNETADQWLGKGIRIDQHGIHFGAAKSITWDALDKLRAVVGGQYPMKCTNGPEHYFGSYGMGKCQRCGLSQMQVYGPAQMAEWEEQRRKHEEFQSHAVPIIRRLRQQGWTIGDDDILRPPRGHVAETFPAPTVRVRIGRDDWKTTTGFRTKWILVGSWLAERFSHVLEEPEPPEPEHSIPSPLPILETPHHQQSTWYKRIFG